MYRIRKVLNSDILYILYSSYILSNITYLNPIWSGSSKIYLNKLDILNKKAIKTINFHPIMYPTNLIYSSRYISFENICKRELYILAYKIINNLIKHNFILNRSIDIHNHNTRNKSNFYLSLFRTDNQKKNCLYNCLKVFNELPNDLKLNINISSFKNKIKEYILS